jgi:hypothetical protein
MGCSLYIGSVWEGSEYFEFFGQHFSYFVRWSFFPIYCVSNGRIFLVYFVKLLIVGGVGLRLMYFHLSSFCMINWQSLILLVLLRSLWNFLVRSFFYDSKLVRYEAHDFSALLVLICNYNRIVFISFRYNSSVNC